MNLHFESNRDRTPVDGAVDHLVRLRFTAPRMERAQDRTPVNMAFVMDRSGSMSGTKMHMAREAIRASIALLSDEDRFSVVMFDDQVEVTTASTVASEEARHGADVSLRGVTARGTTDLGAGWAEGGAQIGSEAGAGRLDRILLATDGKANVGLVDPEPLYERARELRARGITTTTIGIGRDFNEDLLDSIAEHGGGHFYYVEDAKQLPDMLASELGEALEVTVREPRVELNFPRGVLVELVNNYGVERTPDGMRIRLDDLTSGQLVELSFFVRLPAGVAGERHSLACILRGGASQVAISSAALEWTVVHRREFESAPRDLDVEVSVARQTAASGARLAMRYHRAANFADADSQFEAFDLRFQHLIDGNPELLKVIHENRTDRQAFRHGFANPEMKRRQAVAASVLRSRDISGRALRSD